MNIRLIVVGKTDAEYLRTGIADYVSRLGHYVNFDIDTIAAIKEQRNASADEVREREAVQILKKTARCDRVVLLDEHGTERTSTEFAKYLQRQMNAGLRTIAFVVGGAYGFAPSVVAASHDSISLSKMTFTHQMIRLLFVEQLYRAFTILRGEKYHNE